ncbi:uncharacterized protein P884DRAFT_204083 [Thermothelomyces heterothallicus CBS 202.75]|uniref:uncharacterized protein n=1 Tax=Thermothelomyces heterothallicus CBS 202.75 TaxID=1149848 RepID=UPI0037440675
MHHGQSTPGCCLAHGPARFTKFQRLPPEIRNMIWEFALPEARVYEVLDAPNAKWQTAPHEGLMFADVHPEPPPPMAAVCRESRSMFMHHYKPLTLGKTTKYVDLSRDVLLLESYLLIKRLHRTLHFMSQIPLVRDRITQLALGTSYGVYPGIYHPMMDRKSYRNNMGKLLACLAKFPRLETLIFVIHQEYQLESALRFPGTLTPMAPMPVPKNAALYSAYGVVPAATRCPSPPMIKDEIKAESSSHSIPASPTSPTTTTTAAAAAAAAAATITETSPAGLPTPASSTTSSPLPPPTLPLPLTPALEQQPPSPPQHLPLQPQQHPRRNQLHTTLVPFSKSIPSSSPAAAAVPCAKMGAEEFMYYNMRGRWDEFDAYKAYVEPGSPSTSATFADGVERRGRLGFAGRGHDEQSGSGRGGKSRNGGCKLRCAGNGAGSPGRRREGERGEWRDPWPTNNDWKWFRRRWVRAMIAACSPAADAGAPSFGLDGTQMPRWKLRGASLLWRYTRDVVDG